MKIVLSRNINDFLKFLDPDSDAHNVKIDWVFPVHSYISDGLDMEPHWWHEVAL